MAAIKEKGARNPPYGAMVAKKTLTLYFLYIQ